jgi:hypothetical protein
MLTLQDGTILCQPISRSISRLLGVPIAQAVAWFFLISYL